MKRLFFKSIGVQALALVFVLGSAHADGFYCEGESTGLKIAVMNHNSPQAGTRTPETLLISDPTRSPSDQRLVNFTDQSKNLSYMGRGAFLGRVDQSILQTSRADAIVAGIALRQLKSVLVDLRFSYDPATTALARIAKSIPGKIIYTKINGETRDERLTCTRYLKSARN